MLRVMSSFILSIFSLVVFAHGENKPGPHGGHIRMPGSFHTELVMKSKKQFYVYLLDGSFKSPLTTKSTVEIEVANEKKSCDPVVAENYFKCDLAKEIDNSGEIKIYATRNGMKASSEALYQLPLTHGHLGH